VQRRAPVSCPLFTVMLRPACALVALVIASSCAIGQRSLRAPGNDQATVLLLTGGLAHPMNKIARHPWFAARGAGETAWRIYEVGGGGTTEDPFTNPPYVEPILHGVWRGTTAERAIECLAREAPPWLARLRYRFYPGPNSNTFGDAMLRRCRLRASLPASSVGKDWRGRFGVTRTTEGTGVQIETPVLGVRVGLKEGVEVHVIGLAIGVDLWPPAIIVPLGPGRLGFADR
jgi:hypothetical protein